MLLHTDVTLLMRSIGYTKYALAHLDLAFSVRLFVSFHR